MMATLKLIFPRSLTTLAFCSRTFYSQLLPFRNKTLFHAYSSSSVWGYRTSLAAFKDREGFERHASVYMKHSSYMDGYILAPFLVNRCKCNTSEFRVREFHIWLGWNGRGCLRDSRGLVMVEWTLDVIFFIWTVHRLALRQDSSHQGPHRTPRFSIKMRCDSRVTVGAWVIIFSLFCSPLLQIVTSRLRSGFLHV